MRSSCHFSLVSGNLGDMNIKELDAILERKKNQLFTLLETLKGLTTICDKIEILNALPEVDGFFSFPSPVKAFLSELSLEYEYVVKSIFAIGQGLRIFEGIEKEASSLLKALLDDLLAIESFYSDIGGIIGYQYLVLTFLNGNGEKIEKGMLKPPEGIDLTCRTEEINQAIIEGIKGLEKTVELYPVGGAADRLQLKDKKTKEGMPAARLNFLGKPLLEGVIGDLQAREYLHYKLFGKQVITPIGMMTSHIHCNHEHIQEICADRSWFGRPKTTFYFVTQPSVPTFTREGFWCLKSALQLLLKPGGHGMLWKLLRQQGLFEAFRDQGCSKALVRQINNPMAAVDYGLLAFLGIGHQKDKVFGFASCPRLINAQEGINVIYEVSGHEVLTNIEYCDFEKHGIEDFSEEKREEYTCFPSNTNILFADLNAVKKASEIIPNPGPLVNFRHNPDQGEEVARLETTMQNIADAFAVLKGEELPTYVTCYERRKTISTTKRKSGAEGALLETPEGCYYDYMLNAKELLEKHCQMILPKFPDKETFVQEGPSFLFSTHPALGPLFSIMGQKIRKGNLEAGSELQLEIADFDCENLELSGSLLIQATHLMGHKEKDILRYSDQTGRCILKNVRVENEGIDWEEDHLFWRHDIKRKEALKIILHGRSAFIAEGVTLQGDLMLEVPDGMKMTAKEERGQISFVTERFDEKSPLWFYSIDENFEIRLN